MRIITTAMLAAIAGPASAQVIPGIQIGQSQEEAVAIYGAEPVPIVGQPRLQLSFRDDGHVAFCDGVVISIQRKIGYDLHAFTDTVSDLITELGDPYYVPLHLRTADGEVSTFGARWDYEARRYQIGMIYSSGNLAVTETISLLDDSYCGSQ